MPGASGSWDAPAPGANTQPRQNTTSELDALRQRLGIGGAYVDPDDPEVYFGGEVTKAGQIRVRHNVRRMSDVLGDMYRWDDTQLRAFQERAWQAGLYGNVDRDEVAFGARDDDTYRAWSSVVTNAARAYAADRSVTPSDLLDEWAQRTPQDARSGQRQVIRISNPSDLRATFSEVYRARTGKGPKGDVLERLISQYQAEEARAQQAALNGGTVTDAPSPEVFADEFARTNDPEAYDARKVITGLRRVGAMLSGSAA